MMKQVVDLPTVEIDGSMSIDRNQSGDSSLTTEVVVNNNESIDQIDLTVNSDAVLSPIDSTPDLDPLTPGVTTADLPSPGTVVRTLTGLVGVVRHIFQNLSKCFLVYHADLDRAILYGENELFFAT
jgi:hypothetical protein